MKLMDNFGFGSIYTLSGVVAFILIISNTGSVAGVEFTLYEDKNHDCCSWGCGTCEKFSVQNDGCINFNFYSDKVSSIDTHGGCIKIWEHRNCQGASMKMAPGTPSHHDLSQMNMKKGYNWDKELTSVSGCDYGEPRRVPVPSQPSSTQSKNHTST